MLGKLETVIHLLFPPSGDERRLQTDATQEYFKHPRYLKHNDVVYLFPYHEPMVRSAIHLAKFHHHRTARELLGTALGTTLAAEFPHHCCIPIPLAAKRERERGYNQVTEVLYQARTQHPELVVATNVLRRTRHTTPQTKLTRRERLTNLEDAFAVRRPERVRDQHILLIDDVLTTGATLKAARAALAPHSPASITCLALAH